MSSDTPVLSDQQVAIAESPPDRKIFLHGACGTGKTTAGVARLRALLASGVPAHGVLILVPQMTLALPYVALAESDALPPRGAPITITTIAGVARQMIDLYFPLVAVQAGFADPHRPPVYLSLETAQYYMARVLGRVIDERGYFEPVRVDRNRIYSQILDNLNKAAVVGFPVESIGARLKSATVGDEAQKRVYDDVQTCALLFRAYCLQNNLLDFSLQVEVFTRYLWGLPQCRSALTTRYRHLIIDNAEEDNPAAHDLCLGWLNLCDSALVICDEDGGFRRFLGADDQSADRLRAACDEVVRFERSWVAPPELHAFAGALGESLGQESTDDTSAHPFSAAVLEDQRYFTQMVDHVAERVADLVHEQGVSPGEIVVIAPFVSDALQFSLTNRLQRHKVPYRTHRPSRALRQEAAAQALLTLAKLAHPDWKRQPAEPDIAYALVTAISGLDLVRGLLLASTINPRKGGASFVGSFDDIQPEMQARITYSLGERYEHLRRWLVEYRDGLPQPLDHFWSRLFGEVLSQPGYGFHADFQSAEVAANLIDSARRFRLTITVPPDDRSLSQEYVEMVEVGLIADQYLRSWSASWRENAVLIAPAYTFLLQNAPVDYQFWLDIGSDGWAQRLYQPLTHPYVLSRGWQEGRVWLDDDEISASQEALYRLVAGLTRRCRRMICLQYAELSEQGQERRGLLLEAIQRVLYRLSRDAGATTA